MNQPFLYNLIRKYAKVLNNASCCVGNSSSFIREGALEFLQLLLEIDKR